MISGVASESSSQLLPWQQPIWQDLVRRQQQSGLPHALMFTGIAGIGKHELSLRVAHWLLCQNSSGQADGLTEPCGHCHSCQLWQAGSHPDFMVCQPEDNSRQIRIDSIRKVNEFLAQTPQISRCQVVVIRPVEVMNTNAANALLKTLEEPAGESFLLLEAERFGSVLPTIRSRCQRIQLPAPSAEQAQQWLEASGVSPDQASQALRYNPQAPLQAQLWLEHNLGEQQQQWLDLFGQWTQGRAPLDKVVAAYTKMELDDVIHWYAGVLADALKLTLSVAEDQLLHGGWLAQLLNACGDGATLNKTKLITLQRNVQEIQGGLLSGAAHHNKQLLNESLLLQWRALLQ